MAYIAHIFIDVHSVIFTDIVSVASTSHSAIADREKFLLGPGVANWESCLRIIGNNRFLASELDSFAV